MEYPEVMNREQIRSYLGLDSDQVVRKACRMGEIPFFKLRGEYKFYKKAIDEYLYRKSMESLVREQEDDEEEEVIISNGSFSSYNPRFMRG